VFDGNGRTVDIAMTAYANGGSKQGNYFLFHAGLFAVLNGVVKNLHIKGSVSVDYTETGT